MRLSAIRLAIMIAAALGLSPALHAERFYLNYSGDHFPEEEGWTRFAPYPTNRSVGYGLLGLNAWGDISTGDVYFTPYDSIRLDKGEYLNIQWRMSVSETDTAGANPSDLTVGVVNEKQYGATLYITPYFVADSTQGYLEQIYFIRPREFHTFALVSHDLETYDLFVDGTPAFSGVFDDPGSSFSSYVYWGDYILGMASNSAWDYVTVQVVPEPQALVSIVMAVCFLAALRRVRPTAHSTEIR